MSSHLSSYDIDILRVALGPHRRMHTDYCNDAGSNYFQWAVNAGLVGSQAHFEDIYGLDPEVSTSVYVVQYIS